MSRIENNDIKYLSVPKSEYERVLRHILMEDHCSGGIDAPGDSTATSRSVRRHYKKVGPEEEGWFCQNDGADGATERNALYDKAQ